MDRMSRARPPRGLTLVELLVVVVLLAVLISLAVPGFQALQQRLLLRLEAGRLLQAATFARSEAVVRGEPVTLCPAALAAGLRERCAGHYGQGWLVFANPGRAAQPATSGRILRVWSPLGPGLRVRNRAATATVAWPVTWGPDGSAHRNITLMVCSRPRAELPSWSLVLNRLGRPRLARGWGDCDVQA